MKRLLFSAALTLSLAMAPNMGFAQSFPNPFQPPLSVAASPSEATSQLGDFFEDFGDVQRAYFQLIRAFISRDPAAIAAAREQLAAAIADLTGNVGGVGTPAV